MSVKNNWIRLNSNGKIVKIINTKFLGASSLKEALAALVKYAKELEEKQSNG